MEGWEEVQKELLKLPPSLRLYYLSSLLELVAEKKMREVIEREIERAQEEVDVRKDWKRVVVPLVTGVRGLAVPLQTTGEDTPIIRQEASLEAAVEIAPVPIMQEKQIEYGTLPEHPESYRSARYGAFTQEEILRTSRNVEDERFSLEVFERKDYTPLRVPTEEQTKTEAEQVSENIEKRETYKKKVSF